MMKKISTQIDLKELSPYFMDDSWRLIKTFLENLQTKLIEFNVPHDQQSSILNGTEEFIYEFVEEFKNKEKINFNRTLSLLKEIGSPTDIIMSLDLVEPVSKMAQSPMKKITTQTIICKNCFHVNDSETQFCENCGRPLAQKMKIKQEIIDHPYSVSFLGIYVILIVSGAIWGYMFPDLNEVPSNPIFLFYASAVMMLTPTIIISIISGAILNHLTGERKSFKLKYNMALEHFEESFAVGFVILFLEGIIFFFIYSAGITTYTRIYDHPSFVQIPIILILLFPSIVGLFLPFCGAFLSLRKKPSNIPYLTLLKTKKIYNNYAAKQLGLANVYGFIGVIVITWIWGFLFPNLLLESSTEFFGVVFIFLLFMLAYNGIVIMYLYSWPTITRFIEFHL